MEKIELPFFDLRGSVVLEKRAHFLELHPNFIRWKYEAWVNYSENDGDPFTERLLSYNWILRKEDINFICLSYVESPAGWKVTFVEQLDIYFKNEKNARVLMDQLHAYFFGST